MGSELDTLLLYSEKSWDDDSEGDGEGGNKGDDDGDS